MEDHTGMRKSLYVAAVVMLAGFAGCAYLPWWGPQGELAGDVPQPPMDSYRIGSADVLEVAIWKEPDLTRLSTVRTDGKISLPLLGEVQAAGRSTGDLEKELTSKYKSYVENPVVSVIVVQPNSSKFYVVGQVTRPGEYNLPRGITVLQAISTAGGFTEWADQHGLVLIRRAGGEQQHLRVDYLRIVGGSRPQDNCLLLPGDTIVVP